MKLATTIKPRRDGTVTAVGRSGATYHFTPDERGEVVADVHDEGDVAHLLATDNFIPASEADFKQAQELLSQGTTEVDDGMTSGGQEDLDDDDVINPDAGPLEGVSAAAHVTGAVAESAGGILLGADDLPATFLVGEREVQLGEAVAGAHTASGLSVAAWNALSEADRYTAIVAYLESMLPEQPQEQAAQQDPAPDAAAAPAAAPAKTSKKR